MQLVSSCICTERKHTAILRPFFWDYPGELVPEESFFWTFMVQGKITEADTLTIRLDDTPSGLIHGPSPSSPILCRMPFLPQSSHIILAWFQLVLKENRWG